MWGLLDSLSCGHKDSAPDPGAEANPKGKKLNDVVYLLHDPGTQPDVEVVLIHGLRITEDKDAFWTTWLTPDKRICWPATWLQQDEGFPMAARVLSLNYDSSAKKSATEGRFTLNALGESLLQQMYLRDAKVGQNNCPVVFVCHSLGGLVAKKIALTAKYNFAHDKEAHNLLQNLKGFFFYATPHSGSKLFKQVCRVSSSKRSPLLTCLTELDTETARLNDEFEIMKEMEYKDDWRFKVAAESCAVTIEGVTVEAVKYASAKYLGMDCVEVDKANHFDVCRPADKLSTAFQLLEDFLEKIHEDFPPGGLM